MLHLPQWHGQMPQAPCLGTMVQNDWLKYAEIPWNMVMGQNLWNLWTTIIWGDWHPFTTYFDTPQNVQNDTFNLTEKPNVWSAWKKLDRLESWPHWMANSRYSWQLQIVTGLWRRGAGGYFLQANSTLGPYGPPVNHLMGEVLLEVTHFNHGPIMLVAAGAAAAIPCCRTNPSHFGSPLLAKSWLFFPAGSTYHVLNIPISYQFISWINIGYIMLYHVNYTYNYISHFQQDLQPWFRDPKALVIIAATRSTSGEL